MSAVTYNATLARTLTSVLDALIRNCINVVHNGGPERPAQGPTYGRKSSSGFGALFKAAASVANGVARADASQNSGGLGGGGNGFVVADSSNNGASMDMSSF
jgi:hypothetical protein